jgi:2-polyprenyl-6-methoxyphenol hydroxylase-like FAD-dependent oxidoreductase
MILVGDAAGLINPLNGEGIQYALVSGRWAAHVASQALREGDCSAASLSPYARMVSDNLRYDMALAQMIVELIRNRSLKVVWLRSLEVLAARARADPAYAHIAGGVLAGLLPASDLVSRRILLGSLCEMAGTFGVGHLAGGLAQLVRDAVDHPAAAFAWGAGLPPAALELASCAVEGKFHGRNPHSPRVADNLERIFARRSASRAAVRSAGELSRRLHRRVPLSYFTAPFWFTTTSRTPRSSGGVGRRC